MDGHKNIPKRNDLTTRIATNYCAELSDNNSTRVIRIESKLLVSTNRHVLRAIFDIFFFHLKQTYSIKKAEAAGTHDNIHPVFFFFLSL